MERFLILLASLGLVATVANAGQIEKKESWILNEVSTSDGVICEATTADKGVLRDYTLKIQKVKNSHLPVEIFLHEAGKADYGPIAAAIVGSETLLFNQASQEVKSQSFWYLPDETKQFLDLLKSAEKSFDIKPYADLKGRNLRFSLKGAAHILAAMETRCNAGKSLVDDRFSKITNHPLSFDQAPKVFDMSTVATIRANYYEIAEYYNQLVLAEASLAKLIQANAPNINERENLKIERANLINKKIPTLKQDIQSTMARIEVGEKRLVQLKTEIPAAEKQRALAQSRYDEALKKIQPHLPKHNQLVDELRYAKSSLASALNEVAQAENEINTNLRRIQQLDREVQELTYTIQRIRSEIPSAQAQADRALREYNSYNAEYEIRRKLDESYRYRQLKMEAHSLREQIQREREALRPLERELQKAQAQLAQCKTDANATCEAQKAQVHEAQRQVNEKERQISSLENSFQSARREMENIENEIEREVRRIQDRLRDAYNNAAQRVSNLNAQLTKAEGDRREIVEYELPRLKSRNEELKYRIAELERQIVSLRQEVRRAEAALAQFDQSVGFAQLEQNLDTADTQLDAAKSKLSALVSEDSDLKIQVPQEKMRLAQLTDTLKASEARLVQVGQRLVQLDKELASFDSAKVAIDEKIAAIKEQVRAAQSRYMKFFE